MAEAIVIGVVALLVGIVVGWLLAAGRFKEKLAEERARGAANLDKAEWAERAQEQLRESFQALAARTLQTNNEAFIAQTREQLESILKQFRGDWSTQKEQFTNLVQPVEKSLKALDEQVRNLEQRREGAYKALEQHLGDLKDAHRQLKDETGHLRSALTTSSTARGQWGEVQLRRIVEMAGMAIHVDFEEQQQSGGARPDLIVRLPGHGILPVDAKTSLQDFLQASEAESEGERKQSLKAHATAMRNHVRSLGNKEYWKQFEKTPEVVVMFVPNEACLGAAFEEDPELIEFGLEHKVLLATPVTLFGLLRAIAYGWQQQDVADNSRLIADEGRALCDRLGKFLGHLQGTGKGLEKAVQAYNDAIGSAETRLMPSARRLRDLGATTGDIAAPEPIELQPRVQAEPSDEAASA
jgi:DNA recombination protein RmuC